MTGPEEAQPAMRVLVVEDDPVSRTILVHAVNALGHECVVACNGEEAWELYQADPVDVIISDWMMPGMDGVELCRRVRYSAGANRYTYFIFVSALSDKASFLMAMREGADDYLTKPLDRVDLQARLAAGQRVTSLYRQAAEQRSQLEDMSRKLFEEARRDPLTGLFNRRRLQEDLEVMQGRVARYGHRYAIALLDIDRFKSYNDSYGHGPGDEVIQSVATTLQQRCRRGDIVYRYGGEEFLILLPEQDSVSAATMAEGVRLAVEDIFLPHPARPGGDRITISVGVAGAGPEDVKDSQVLIEQADQALYLAKQSGRNRVAMYDDAAGRSVLR
jgi:two-component system cell cycle response regulator